MLEFECKGQRRTRLLGIMGCGACCFGLVAKQHTSFESSWYTGYWDITVTKKEQWLLWKYLKSKMYGCLDRGAMWFDTAPIKSAWAKWPPACYDIQQASNPIDMKIYQTQFVQVEIYEILVAWILCRMHISKSNQIKIILLLYETSNNYKNKCIILHNSV